MTVAESLDGHVQAAEICAHLTSPRIALATVKDPFAPPWPLLSYRTHDAYR